MAARTETLAAALEGNEGDALWAGDRAVRRALVRLATLRQHQRPARALEGARAKRAGRRLQRADQRRHDHHLRAHASDDISTSSHMSALITASDQRWYRYVKMCKSSSAGWNPKEHRNTS